MTSPEQQRNEVLTHLTRAVILLKESMDVRLVAGTGTNICYAVSGARDRYRCGYCLRGAGGSGQYRQCSRRVRVWCGCPYCNNPSHGLKI